MSIKSCHSAVLYSNWNIWNGAKRREAKKAATFSAQQTTWNGWPQFMFLLWKVFDSISNHCGSKIFLFSLSAQLLVLLELWCWQARFMIWWWDIKIVINFVINFWYENDHFSPPAERRHPLLGAFTMLINGQKLFQKQLEESDIRCVKEKFWVFYRRCWVIGSSFFSSHCQSWSWETLWG